MPDASPRSNEGGARWSSRLAVRIYLVGLAQFVLVALGMVLAAREARRAEPSKESLRLVADSIAAKASDGAAVAATLANAEAVFHTSLALYDDDGRLLAGTPRPDWAPPPRLHLRRFGPPPDLPPGPRPPHDGPPPDEILPFLHPGPHHPDDRAFPIDLHDGRVWLLIVTAPPPLSSPLRGVGIIVGLVLFVVGISSWFVARSLTRPLARLTAAAHSFGAGDLKARADVGRRDELGDVASAFDRMADRVTLALRAEKELLANVSHELRTPLQRIRIAMDLAAEGDAATALESLADITEDLAELERIVEDVLDAARLSLRRDDGGATALPPIHMAPLDLHALVEKAETRFRALHPEREIQVKARTGVPLVEGDAVLLRRALDNLLDNAHKYTDDPQAPIELALALAEQRAVVTVNDHGIGIDAEDQKRLFEPFFRADRSRARSSGGLGLGLALAKRIVDAHGGTLTLTSKLGEGTTARIELPSKGAAPSLS